jgi:hypothetical protein
MASAAYSNSADLLLRYLALTGWHVEFRDDGTGVSALAVRDDARNGRIAAWAKTRAAAAIVLFEQACSAPKR